MLGYIQAAGTKQHGKQRQHQRHHQRGIFRAQCTVGRHRTARRAAEQAVTQHNALELQGNVGQHRDQTEQRDNHAQALGLAVARGNKVGNGGDVFLFADGDHARVQAPAKQKQQQGAKIDGQEAPQLVGGHANRAKEGPAGAPDRQRQAVDPDAQARLENARVAITPEGDHKQQCHVQQKNEGYQPAGEHHGACSIHCSVTACSLAVPSGFAQQTSVVAGHRRGWFSSPVPSAAIPEQPGCGCAH